MEAKREETKTQHIQIAKLERFSRDKDAIIDDLKRKIVRFESDHLKLLDDRSKLARLFEMGLIDSAGDPILVEPQEDNETTNKEEYMRF